jgi:hypothetical protein
MEDLNTLTEKEQAAGDIWIGKINHFIENDITSVASGPSAFCTTFIFEGQGNFSIKNARPIAVEPNTVLLYYSPNHCQGEDHIYKNTHLYCLNIRFPSKQSYEFEKFISHLLAPTFRVDASTQDALLASVPMNATLKSVAMDIYNCNLPKGSARELFLQAKSLESLSRLMAFLEKNIITDLPLTQSDKQSIFNAADLIDQNFHQAWTIAGLAKEVGLNEKKLMY